MPKMVSFLDELQQKQMISLLLLCICTFQEPEFETGTSEYGKHYVHLGGRYKDVVLERDGLLSLLNGHLLFLTITIPFSVRSTTVYWP
jgi:hypothetical protein